MMSMRRYLLKHGATLRFGVRFVATSSSEASLRTRLLDKSLEHVAVHGWSQECLSAAAVDLDLPPLVHQVVHNGAADMVCHFLSLKLEHVRKVMAEAPLSAEEADPEGDRRIALAIESHLRYTLPYRSSWAEAMAVSLDPRAALVCTLPAVFQIADDLCHFAGVRASHLDWYTERGLMLLLFSSTELFFLTDSSDDLADTRCTPHPPPSIHVLTSPSLPSHTGSFCRPTSSATVPCARRRLRWQLYGQRCCASNPRSALLCK